MHIRLYITKLTDEVCAERWGFKASRVRDWRRGYRHPPRKAVLHILEVEKDILTIHDIMGPMPEGVELEKQLAQIQRRRSTDKPTQRFRPSKSRA